MLFFRPKCFWKFTRLRAIWRTQAPWLYYTRHFIIALRIHAEVYRTKKIHSGVWLSVLHGHVGRSCHDHLSTELRYVNTVSSGLRKLNMPTVNVYGTDDNIDRCVVAWSRTITTVIVRKKLSGGLHGVTVLTNVYCTGRTIPAKWVNPKLISSARETSDILPVGQIQ